MNVVSDEKVYVHCTAGMGRAPAIVVTYICLFHNLEVDDVDLFVKQHRKVAVPNLNAIREALRKFKEGN